MSSQTDLTSAEPGRRERNKQEKRRRILAAAGRLFRRKGFAGTTTQEIATAAGIAAGTLFLYARSKEDLLLLVFMDEMQEVIARAFAAVPLGAPLVDQLMHVFGVLADYHAEDVPLARAFIREIAFNEDRERRREVMGVRMAINAGVARLIGQAQQRREISRELDPGDAAQVYFSVYFLLLQNWLNDDIDRASFDSLLRRRLQTAVAGSRARAARAGGKINGRS
jgi:AcrR family transcriptional regulator